MIFNYIIIMVAFMLQILVISGITIAYLITWQVTSFVAIFSFLNLCLFEDNVFVILDSVLLGSNLIDACS